MAGKSEVRVVREVDLEKLVGDSLREFYNEWVLLFSRKVQERAPHDHGFLEGSLGPGGDLAGVDDANPPRWAKVGTKKKYAQPLNDPKSRTPHYRTKFEGEPTAGWFDKGIENAIPGMDKLVDILAKEVEDGWRR